MQVVYFFISLGLKLIYYPCCLFKVKNNKITFLSRQSNKPSIDFKYIKNGLLKKNPHLEIVFLCKRLDSKKQIFEYFIFTIKSIYHIATSKICIIDSYSITSILPKRKGTKVIQIWHALGAIKKFSYQTLDTEYGRSKKMAKMLKMHKGYDLIITTSDKTTEYFRQAFNYDKDIFYKTGLPRIDYLLNEQTKIRKNIFKKYPELKNKKVILYAPTFRKDKTDVNKLIKQIDFNKYNLIIKGHFNQEIKVNNKKVYTCLDVSAMDLLTVADYLITDYSAIALEAMVLNKKVFYYLYDYQQYQKSNGLNVDLKKELPSLCFDKPNELIKHLEKNYPWAEYRRYYDKYLENVEGNSTAKIVDKIIDWSCDEVEKA